MKEFRYWTAVIISLILALCAWIILYVQNSDVLYQFQEGQLFIPGKDFLEQQLIVPGGIFTWFGLYLQQYFYHPMQGTLMMTAIWMISFWALVTAFDLKGAKSVLAAIPVSGLMASIVNTGYWIFVLKAPEYAVTPSLFFMAASLLMLPGRCMGKPFRFIWQTAVMAVFVALGLHWMKTAQIPAGLGMPFYVTLFSTVILLPSGLADRINILSRWYTSAASAVIAGAILFLFPFLSSFRNDAYKAELRMTRLIEDARWDDAIRVAHSVNGKATREIWMLRNIALFNKGTLGSELYSDSPMTVLPKDNTGVGIHMLESAGPLIYFMSGKTHFAYRWCMENSVEYGPSAGRLRLMAMCAIIHGEKNLAEKYLDLLSKTRFHAEWAQNHRKYLEDSKLIELNPAFSMSRKLYQNASNIVDTDGGMCENYLMTTMATLNHATDPDESELCLMYSMQLGDVSLFWNQLVRYAMLHQGKVLPKSFQEAVVLYRSVAPQYVPEGLNMNALHIDPSIQKDFEKMVSKAMPMIDKGMELNKVAEQTYAEFGRTFFWYYLFCSEYETY